MQKIIQELKDENKNLKEENKNLKKEKKNSEEKIDDLKDEIDRLIKTKNIDEIVNKYKKTIEEKENTIEMLKSRFDDINADLKDGEKLLAINFKTYNGFIYLPVICKNKTVFKDVENQLYTLYPKYKNNENFYMYGDYKIDGSNRSKKLEEIGIHGYI